MFRLALAILGLFALCSSGSADVFHFRDGRVVTGEVESVQEKKNEEGIPVTTWIVRLETQPKSYMKIRETELERYGHEKLSDQEIEYAKRAKAMPDDAASHVAMAGWCDAKGLSKQSQAHYRRALDLDPNHEVARAGAGYLTDVNGRWVKEEVIMRDQRGKVFDGRRWRYPESVVIEQREEAHKKAQGAVTKQVMNWHRDALLNSGPRQAQALESLQAVKDPLAITPLSDLVLERNRFATSKPAPPQLKLLYINVLAKFGPAAAGTLAEGAIQLPQTQLRHACLEALAKSGKEIAIPVFVGYLRSKNNELVNRAGEGLGNLQADNAILALIRAVTTSHTFESGNGNTNYSTGSMSFGSNKKSITKEINNPGVLAALSQLTGQGFEYSKPRWLAWYASVYAAPADDLRRDL